MATKRRTAVVQEDEVEDGTPYDEDPWEDDWDWEWPVYDYRLRCPRVGDPFDLLKGDLRTTAPVCRAARRGCLCSHDVLVASQLLGEPDLARVHIPGHGHDNACEPRCPEPEHGSDRRVTGACCCGCEHVASLIRPAFPKHCVSLPASAVFRETRPAGPTASQVPGGPQGRSRAQQRPEEIVRRV